MSASTTARPSPAARAFDRVLRGIERAGNALPHPFFLFCYLFAAIALVSSAMAWAGATVTVPGSDEVLPVQGFLSTDGVLWLLSSFATNFSSFPPFGTVLMMLMAVGVAERSGLLGAAVTAVFGRAPRRVVPYAVALVACQGHVMSDVATIVLPPLAALVFLKAGRHPVAGMIGTFACVVAGYSGGVLVGVLDTLLYGITVEAASVLPGADVSDLNVLMNIAFTATSGVVLGLLGGFLIDRVLEPRLGAFDAAASTAATDDLGSLRLEPAQRRGLLATVAVLVVYLGGLALAWLWPGSPLQGEGGTLVPSPLLSGVIPVIFGAFLLAGIVYGVVAGTLPGRDALPAVMAESVKTMAGYVVLIFVIAQAIALFSWSNLGSWLAVEGAALLESVGLTGFTAVVLFVLLVFTLNLVITSGSALWSLVAPVFVPAFMLLGYDPALTQAAFRIGDSASSPLSPLNPYLVILLTLVQRWEPGAKLGTVMSRMAVFVLPFLVVWLVVLGLFFAFDLPLGPGGPIRLPE
ncbi:AbgT family transporter [Kineococcus sp. SYSU DK001]|uniref:AbgT family transporter n=1 Tax=Kineococcus sp. SYSU DK001 TaxID=3383122 RepID=UPI003D7EB71C